MEYLPPETERAGEDLHPEKERDGLTSCLLRRGEEGGSYFLNREKVRGKISLLRQGGRKAASCDGKSDKDSSFRQ